MRINPDILTNLAEMMAGTSPITADGPQPSFDGREVDVLVAENPLKEKQLSVEVPGWTILWIDATLRCYLQLRDRASVYDLALDRVFNSESDVGKCDIDNHQQFLAEQTAFDRLADIGNSVSFPAARWLSFNGATVRLTVPYSFLEIMRDVLAVVDDLPGISGEALRSRFPHRPYSLSDVLKDVGVCFGVILRLYKPQRLNRSHVMEG